MSEDCISRQDAIIVIKNLYPDMPIVDIFRARQKWLEKYAPYFECENAIEQLPSVTPKQRWIPVGERLPNDRNIVLVTAYWHETYQVMVGSYFGNGDWWCTPWNNTGDPQQLLKVKAWMPLPEPYKVEPQESQKVNCKSTKCENCINHNYCDYEPQEREEV